jgi:catechol 2,3-dioxygenase-like lactoylglutathione lyase family enzyme
MFKPSGTSNVRQAVPFFMVTDIDASLRFYVDGLGFRMTNSWRPEGPDKVTWCALQHGDAGIMLQKFWQRDGKTGRPEGALGQGFTVCFVCEDALAFYREALKRGISPVNRPFVGNNMWVVSYADPDGYRIDFESDTKVPEETEYDPALHD